MATSCVISLSDDRLKGREKTVVESKICRLLDKLGFMVNGLHLYPSSLDHFPLKNEIKNIDVLVIIGGLGKIDFLKDLGKSIGLQVAKIDDAIEHIQSRIFEVTQDLRKAYSREELKKYDIYSFSLEGAYVLPNSKGILPGFFIKYDKKFIVFLPSDKESIDSILDEGLEYYLRSIAGVKYSTTINMTVSCDNVEVFEEFISDLNKLPVFVDYFGRKGKYNIVIKIFTREASKIDDFIEELKRIKEKFSDKLDIFAPSLKDFGG